MAFQVNSVCFPNLYLKNRLCALNSTYFFLSEQLFVFSQLMKCSEEGNSQALQILQIQWGKGETLLIPVAFHKIRAEGLRKKVVHSSLGRKYLKIYRRPLCTVLLFHCHFEDYSSAFIANIYVSNWWVNSAVCHLDGSQILYLMETE